MLRVYIDGDGGESGPIAQIVHLPLELLNLPLHVTELTVDLQGIFNFGGFFQELADAVGGSLQVAHP